MTKDEVREWGELKINDRVWFSGGYEDARWLCGKSGYYGIVMTFISGQNKGSSLNWVGRRPGLMYDGGPFTLPGG